MIAGKQSAYEAIAHPVRRDILKTLQRGPSPVHRLTEQYSISQQAVSKHLRILNQCGLTRNDRRGQENIYYLNAAPLREVRDWLDDFWTDKLTSFKSLAEETYNEQ